MKVGMFVFGVGEVFLLNNRVLSWQQLSVWNVKFSQAFGFRGNFDEKPFNYTGADARRLANQTCSIISRIQDDLKSVWMLVVFYFLKNRIWLVEKLELYETYVDIVCMCEI